MKVPFFIFILVGFSAEIHGLEQRTKDEIVKMHNELRSTIAKGDYDVKGEKLKKSTNMRTMYWSDALAEQAQQVVNCNVKKHTHFGQNLHWAPQPKGQKDFHEHAIKAVQMLGSEIKEKGLIGYTLTDAVFNSGVGHTSQMIWAESYLVGCAVTDPEVAIADQNPDLKLYTFTCHYWPTGNMLGSPIYLQGDKPCSNCGKGFKCGKMKLCEIDEESVDRPAEHNITEIYTCSANRFFGFWALILLLVGLIH